MSMPAHTRRFSPRLGFSIVELMVVLAIASIITTMAIPSFQDTIDRQKLSAASSDLYASVAMTRNEAIRRGGRVELTAINNNWNNGWEVNVLNGGRRERIYRHGPVPNGIGIAQTGLGNNLSYDGTGRTTTPRNSQAVVTGRWVINVNRAGSPHRRFLRINTVGRPLLCNPAANTTCT